MGKKSRDKGNREERKIREIFESAGIECKRVPLSGAVKGFKGDLLAEIGGETCKIEVKVRANGFKALYTFLDDNDYLVVRADRKEPLIVMPLKDYLERRG